MSADRHRGIRRQKQKRAKDRKKQLKLKKPPGVERSSSSSPEQKAG